MSKYYRVKWRLRDHPEDLTDGVVLAEAHYAATAPDVVGGRLRLVLAGGTVFSVAETLREHFNVYYHWRRDAWSWTEMVEL